MSLVSRVLVPVLRHERRPSCDPSCQRVTSWCVCVFGNVGVCVIVCIYSSLSLLLVFVIVDVGVVVCGCCCVCGWCCHAIVVIMLQVGPPGESIASAVLPRSRVIPYGNTVAKTLLTLQHVSHCLM